jgi:hypothetical protein
LNIIRDLVAFANSAGRPRAEDVLVNIEAAERAGGRLIFRNAGVLFFARNVRHFFNQAYITCLLAKGTDKVHVLDRKDFDGGIVADIEDAMRFIERNTRTAWRIEGLRRQDIPEYPMKALREAVTNAVMHRDWFVEGANVFVEIYTLRDREHFRKGYLEPLLTVGWLERTIPDKPRSSRQRYRATAAGREVLGHRKSNPSSKVKSRRQR